MTTAGSVRLYVKTDDAAEWEEAAARVGLSMPAYIRRAMQAQLERDSALVRQNALSVGVTREQLEAGR